jgi:DNA-binding transcriptional ArsR family regulator
MESEQAVAALAALAQATRLAIYRLLVQAGPAGLNVGEINEALDVAPATLSFHLKELARAGLIENRQEGRFIYCRANFAGMNELLDFLTENCCEASGAACSTPRCAPARSASPTPRRRPHEKVSRPSRRR